MDYPTPSPGLSAWASLFAVGVLLPMLVFGAIALTFGKTSRLFKLLWLVPVVTVPAAIAVALLGFLNPLLRVDQEIIAKSGTYEFREPLKGYNKGNVKIYRRGDALDGDFAIAYRDNGISLFGFQLGWFTLKNGGRAFVWSAGEPYLIVLAPSGKPALMVGMKAEDDAKKFLEQMPN